MILEADKEMEGLIELLLDVYTSDEYWDLPTTQMYVPIKTHTSVRTEATTSESLLLEPNSQSLVRPRNFEQSSFLPSDMTISFQELNSNIQLICLFLEGISSFAKYMRTNFSPLLINSLYKIIGKAGNENAAICRTAQQTIVDICSSCGYDSISDLIVFNSDYLVNSITLEFRHLMSDTSASDVLCVIFRHCTDDVLLLVSDVMEDVFTAMDRYQDEVAAPMLRVLRAANEAVIRWFVKESNAAATTSNSTSTKERVKVGQFLFLDGRTS